MKLIYILKKKNFQKERVPVWSLNKYNVNRIVHSIGQDYYDLDGYTKPMLRHEILINHYLNKANKNYLNR